MNMLISGTPKKELFGANGPHELDVPPIKTHVIGSEYPQSQNFQNPHMHPSNIFQNQNYYHYRTFTQTSFVYKLSSSIKPDALHQSETQNPTSTKNHPLANILSKHQYSPKENSSNMADSLPVHHNILHHQQPIIQPPQEKPPF